MLLWEQLDVTGGLILFSYILHKRVIYYVFWGKLNYFIIFFIFFFFFV